jgi:patatin-like phospholipase/acyl hydrolase
MELKKIAILYLSLISTFSWARDDDSPSITSFAHHSQEMLPIEKTGILLDTSITINVKDLDDETRARVMRILMALKVPYEIPMSLTPLHSEIQHTHKQSMRKNRVLCLDGGGTRGIIEATILTYIEETTGKQIYELFDIVICSSTGTIIGAGLCYDRPLIESTSQTPSRPYTAKEMGQFYRDEAPNIFSGYIYSSVYGLRGTQYSDDPARKVYAEYTGKTLLSEARTKFIATTQDLSSYSPHVFSSEVAKQGTKYATLDLVTVIRTATAAPTFFDPIVIEQTSHCDGGITNNNPAEIGILEACEQLGLSPHELLVLSLGAGFTDPNPSKSYTNLGGTEWLGIISGNIFNGKNQDFTVSQWLKLCRKHDVLGRGNEKNYLRIQPNLPSELYKLDAHSSDFFDGLVKVAEEEIVKHKEALDEFIDRLTQDS